jgi:type I restriction enzyme S subunit
VTPGTAGATLGWEKLPLKRLVRLVGGHTPTTSNEMYWIGDVPWFSPKDMKSRVLADAIDHISELAVRESGLQMLPTGTTLVVVRGMILAHTFPVCVTGRPGTINQDMKALIPDKRVEAAFLPWLLRGWAPIFLSLTDQSAHGTMALRTDRFLGEPLLIPPLAEQQAMAAYLDAETARIDLLIEEKRRLVKVLGEFRTEVVRERTTGADLKSDRWATDDTFMPELPLEWSLVPVGRFSRITNGSTPLKDNPSYWQGGHYPWLNSSVVNNDEVIEGSELVTSEALRQCHLPIVPAGSVLVALTGQGKTRGQATVLRIEATINQHLAAIVCDEDHLDGEFVFWALTGQYAALRMVSDGQGGTKGALTCDELGRFRIPKPPIDIQRSISKALYEETRRIDDLRNHVEAEIALLQELRSATITDAVLGRIDVRAHTKN